MSVDVDQAPRSTEDQRRLEQERDFLLRSIDDLDAERAAGDVSEEDFAALRGQYTARAAAVLRALEQRPTDDVAAKEGPSSTMPRRAPRRGRKWLVWGAGAMFGAAAVVLVVAEVTSRLPGETSSGSVSLPAAEQLQRTLGQAQVLESEGKASQALGLYHQVLQRDPTQEQALAESGWLEYEAGVAARNAKLLSTGQSTEQQAEEVDPQAYAPHLYLGSMLLAEGQSTEAASEFSEFLTSDPPVAAEQAAWPFVVRAFSGAGRPVPPTPPGVSG